jgi:hypothetical protein
VIDIAYWQHRVISLLRSNRVAGERGIRVKEIAIAAAPETARLKLKIVQPTSHRIRGGTRR